jgi:Chromate transporter.
MIGWEQGGFVSALGATLSVVTFPVIAILTATYLARFLKLRADTLNESLKTGSIAMMLMALWALKPTSVDPVLIAFALGAFALAAFTKINALWAILGSGALNAIAGPAIRALLGIKG